MEIQFDPNQNINSIQNASAEQNPNILYNSSNYRTFHTLLLCTELIPIATTDKCKYVETQEILNVNVVLTVRKRNNGNVFRNVCQEFCPRRWGHVCASMHWERYTPRQVHPHDRYNPWQVHPREAHPLGKHIPPMVTAADKFSDKEYLSLKGPEPATSCVGDQDSTTTTRKTWS